MTARSLESSENRGQENPGQARGYIGSALRWIGALGIVTVAVMRCVIAFAPQLVFDIDPAIDPTPLPGLGPPGSLFLDAVLLAACGCGLLGEALSRRGIDWLLVVLSLIPFPLVVWHGIGDLGNLWRGSTWVAAAVAGMVIAHLGRDRSMRMVLIAVLSAVLVPIAVRGAMQAHVSIFGWSVVGAEYAQTVAEFEANRDAFFADHGWEPESSAARIYERRLRQPNPRGWFPTTNIFASMMGFGLIMGVGLAVGSVRAKAGKWWFAAMALGAAVAAGGLLLSGSKGALLAAAAGLAVLLAPILFRQAGPLLGRYGPAVAIALVLAAPLAVVVRGTLLGESWLGEKSLLFRWHYLVGASRMISQHPGVGVGPDGFQAAYAAVRLPRSPEEVTSAHSMFADWLATLGPIGAAWIGLVLILLWRAGRRLGPDEIDEHSSSSPNSRAPLLASAAVAVLALLPAITQEALSLNSITITLSRGAGVLGYVVAAAGLSIVLARAPRSIVNWTLTAAVVALAVHAQIEMTFFDPGSVVWMMCALGLAGGAVGRGKLWLGFIAGPLVLGGALFIGRAGAYPAFLQQILTNKAASGLYPPSEDRRGQTQQRATAVELLTDAYEVCPANVLPLHAAARQAVMAAATAPGAKRIEWLKEAAEMAQRAVADHGKPGSISLAGEAHRLKALLTNDADDWQAAIRHARHMTEIDPHGIGVWRRLGDVLWETGDRAGAADAYRRALANDANFELDELKQLPQRERDLLHERIDHARQ